MIRKQISIFVFGILLAAPAYSQPTDFRLGDLEYSFAFNIGDGEQSDVFFSSISDVTSDPQQNIYVLERRPVGLYSYSAEGQLRWKNNDEGAGPGELNRPGSIDFFADRLLLGNQRGTRIDLFTPAGDFIDSWTNDELNSTRFSLIGIMNDSLLAISMTVEMKYGVTIRILSLDDFHVMEALTVEQKSDNPPPRQIRLTLPVSLMGNRIAVGHFYQDSFRLFNQQLDFTSNIPPSDGNFIAPIMKVTNGSPSIHLPISSSSPRPIEDKYWFTKISWPIDVDSEDEYMTQLQLVGWADLPRHTSARLFSAEGELVQVVYDGPAENSTFFAIHHANNGLLIVQFEEDDPVLSVYRLQ